MKLKFTGMAAGLLLVCCLGCGNSVQGNTYADANGMMKIDFQSGGKALVTIGMSSQNCQWSQSSSNIAVKCADDTMQLTLNNDGSLAGPPNGMVGPLTKVKQ
ncbi:MAG TPA: hypothetical protein VGG72_21675 [Bryobacteraceae bacterium]|jgi:hypothetical protein